MKTAFAVARRQNATPPPDPLARGLMLAIADGALKLMLAPTLREWLYAKLQAEAAELPAAP